MAGVSNPAANISMTVRSDECSSAAATVTSGTINPWLLPQPRYLLVSAATPSSHQTSSQTVNVLAGTIVNKINFFFYQFPG
jgi:hypothetical protein